MSLALPPEPDLTSTGSSIPPASATRPEAARGPLPRWALLSMAGAATLTFALSREGWAPADIRQESAFWVLFRQDQPAALLGLSIAAASLFFAGLLPRRLLAAVEALGRRPGLFVAGFAAVAAAASLFAYRAYPLSMDEYAPWFQAKAFAAGRLTGKVPPELLPRIVPTFHNYFLETASDGRIIEAYWPGLALLLAPFMLLGVPWLLNPLLGAASLAVLWHLARKLLPEKTWGWVLLFALASPAFLVNAISFYSMSAHLLCSLVFAALLLEAPGAGRTALAGAVGSLALILHNPFPHALFAAPWVVWIALRPRQRHLGALLLGYLPLGLLSGIGWSVLRASIQSQNPAGAQHVALSTLVMNTFGQAFALPRVSSLWARLAGFTKLVVWASPGLVALACIGAVVVLRDRGPERTPLRLLALSGLLTLAAYVLVPWDQGHGWGYRYFHSAWGVLPLLAAVALLEPLPDAERFTRAMLAAALASLLLATPLRLFQVRRFMDRQLAQIPPKPTTGFSVTFVRPWRGFYTIDMVQNDPFLESDRWMLYSRGDAEDARFAHALSADARPLASSEAATVWAIPRRK
jgi:hypothetical protein